MSQQNRPSEHKFSEGGHSTGIMGSLAKVKTASYVTSVSGSPSRQHPFLLGRVGSTIGHMID